MKRTVLRILMIVVLAGMAVSCSLSNNADLFMKEDQLIQSRKYIGDFVDYCGTETDTYEHMNLIWIKTTVFNEYGQLSAFTRDCKFQPGDRIYLKSFFHTNGRFGNWEHRIENESSVSYRVNECIYDNRLLVQNMTK